MIQSPEKIRLLICDFDGVIVNTPIVGHERAVEVFGEFEVPAPSWKEWFEDYRLSLLKFYDEMEVEIETVDELHEFFNEFSRDIMVSAYPDVPDALKRLKDRGIQIIIVSSNRKDVIEPLCYQYHIHQYFRYIFGEVYDKGAFITDYLREYHYSPEEAVMIEDFPIGIEAARKAGVWTVGKKTSKETDHLLLDAGAHQTISTFTEILDIFPEKKNGALFRLTIGPCDYGHGQGKEYTLEEFDEHGGVREMHEGKVPRIKALFDQVKRIIPAHIFNKHHINDSGITDFFP